MNLPSSLQVPGGPMTRARARALETEVTSLLSQFHFNAHETWLLPQTQTLCILRYQGVGHEEAKEQGECHTLVSSCIRVLHHVFFSIKLKWG